VVDVIGIQAEVASNSTASCEALLAIPTWSSTYDCILLNAISTLAPCASLWVEFLPLLDLSEHATLPDVEILKLEVGSPLHIAAKTRQQNYDQNRHFQDRWVAFLPWVEVVVGGDGRVSQVCCKVYSHVEGQESTYCED
jgi:hypothetical protein